MENNCQISRHLSFSNDVLFIDGAWGTGKSILGPVLSCFHGVEKQKLDHIFEYVATAYNLGEISKGFANSLIKTYVDLDTFDSQISREVNFRPSDDSGILNNPNGLKYFKRLFLPGDDRVKENIENNNPALQIMSHHILPVADVLFESLDNRIKLIEMFRHPLFMIDHWVHYIDRVGTDSREFTVWIKYNDKHLPWFVKGWEEKFLSLNSLEKVIHSISHIQNLIFDAIANDSHKNKLLAIPFEGFVLNPHPYIEKIETFLGRKRTSSLQKVLRRQKCPRESLLAGRGHKSYGFKKTPKNNDDYGYVKVKLAEMKSNIADESFQLLISASLKYEAYFNFDYVGKSYESYR